MAEQILRQEICQDNRDKQEVTEAAYSDDSHDAHSSIAAAHIPSAPDSDPFL
jgi:hypothetical protein